MKALESILDTSLGKLDGEVFTALQNTVAPVLAKLLCGKYTDPKWIERKIINDWKGYVQFTDDDTLTLSHLGFLVTGGRSWLHWDKDPEIGEKICKFAKNFSVSRTPAIGYIIGTAEGGVNFPEYVKATCDTYIEVCGTSLKNVHFDARNNSAQYFCLDLSKRSKISKFQNVKISVGYLNLTLYKFDKDLAELDGITFDGTKYIDITLINESRWFDLELDRCFKYFTTYDKGRGDDAMNVVENPSFTKYLPKDVDVIKIKTMYGDRHTYGNTYFLGRVPKAEGHIPTKDGWYLCKRS